MKHLLIILISILLLSSPLFGQETGVLYQYETSSGIQWKTFGDSKVQPMYKGEIKNGKMDGLGVLIYPYDGKSIVGEWKNGNEWDTKHTKKDGTLIGKWVNGEWKISWGVLFGRDVNGKWEWYEDGDEKKDKKYVGEIENGEPNGQGTYTFPNSTQNYVGTFEDGQEEGQGTFTWGDGVKYVGGYKDGKKHGQGTMTRSDGTKVYVGGYKDGKNHGQGTFWFSNGYKFVGEWKDGNRWNGTMVDKDGKIDHMYVNGK